MISYNTQLVNGVMEVLERAGIFNLSTPEIIKLVEEKFTSTNKPSVPCEHEFVERYACKKCGGVLTAHFG